jgi:hypothetical protein
LALRERSLLSADPLPKEKQQPRLSLEIERTGINAAHLNAGEARLVIDDKKTAR